MLDAISSEIDIDAPLDRVFEAWTDPQQRLVWWGDDAEYHGTNMASDLRVGGRWRCEGVSAAGQPFAVEGEYTHVEPPRVLGFTWKYDWGTGPVTHVLIELSPTATGTHVKLTHSGFVNKTDRDAHHVGWQNILGWLVRYLFSPAARTRFFFCRLIPPRPTFAIDMNTEERAMMEEHVAYWTGHMQLGIAIVFGPVADPSGPWGMAVLRVRDDAELGQLQTGDPAIRSGLGFRYENLPMPRAVTLNPP